MSAYWLDQALNWIRSNPGNWVRLTGRKLLLLLNRTENADAEDLATHSEWSVVLRAAAIVLHFGILAPLALLGMWISRDRWRSLWPLYSFCAVFALSVLAFFVLDRYRYPVVPVLVLFAGGGLAEIGRYWKSHGIAERARTLVLTAFALVACNWPLLSSTAMQAMTHFNVATVLHDEGLDDQAEAEFRTAIRLEPALAVAHANLGALLMAKGDEAKRWLSASKRCGSAHSLRRPTSTWVFETAVRLDPGFREAAANLEHAVQLAGERK